MKRPLLAVAGAIALLAACGPKTTEKTPDANPSATIPTAANEAASPDFVQLVALSDMFELEAAKIAQARATDPEVKQFAMMMAEAHTKSTEALKTAITASGQALTLPAALDEDHQKKLEKLNKADAKDFDETYMDSQVVAHQRALDLLSRYANDGPDGPLKTFANDTKTVVQGHMSSAENLEDKVD